MPTADDLCITKSALASAKLLFRGGQGAVYQAKALSGLRLAIKAYTGSSYDLEVVAIKKIMHINSPFIAAAYGVVPLRGALGPEFKPDGIAFQLADSDLLQAVERKRGISELSMSPLAVQVLTALIAAHACGVSHLDIKPENLLLYDNGARCALTDWGGCVVCGYNDLRSQRPFAPEHLKRSFLGKMYTAQAVGSVMYAAPECVLNMERQKQVRWSKSKIGTPESAEEVQRVLGQAHHHELVWDAFAADVWCLGVTLYVCVACRPPFASATYLDPNFRAFLQETGQTEAMHRMLGQAGWTEADIAFVDRTMPLTVEVGEFHWPYRFTDDMKDLLMQCLRVDPAERARPVKLFEHKWVQRGIPRVPEHLASKLGGYGWTRRSNAHQLVAELRAPGTEAGPHLYGMNRLERARNTEDYLARGGVIHTVPRKPDGFVYASTSPSSGPGAAPPRSGTYYDDDELGDTPNKRSRGNESVHRPTLGTSISGTAASPSVLAGSCELPDPTGGSAASTPAHRPVADGGAGAMSPASHNPMADLPLGTPGRRIASPQPFSPEAAGAASSM